MPLSIIFRPEAEKDVEKIYKWYESQQETLGDEFLLILQQQLELIREYPKAFQIIHKNIRRLILPRFPYLVFYIPIEDTIVVLAVLHAFRNPADWPQS